MADDQIKPGDQVRLKSGGPVMTVNYQCSNELFQCIWFHDNLSEFRSERFSAESLQKAE